MIVVNISNEDLKKLEEAFMPSPWLQRAIDRIHSMTPYPSKDERRKILDEEKKRGNFLKIS